ncbi:MAG: hypothetical protein PUG68_10030 [Lachnospiraceae bacterium]|nr:hypothetical protein [Lachnospiraceae bacterium]MDD7328112.1 hypothetical protein [Lachnospiraceae bacterium]MDY2760453.1 hypothetical protein [Lachnospiraceae bacterium]
MFIKNLAKASLIAGVIYMGAVAVATIVKNIQDEKKYEPEGVVIDVEGKEKEVTE